MSTETNICQEQRLIQVNGRALYAEEHGPHDGMAAVLLHHGVGSVASWEAQIPRLAQAGFRTIAYDRWGFGRSEPRPSYPAPFFEEDLSDLDGILEELGIERAVLVGHSDGGTIALYYAAQNPGRVSALAVVSAHIYLEASMRQGMLEVRSAYDQKERFREGLARLHGENAERVFDLWHTGWTTIEERFGAQAWDMRPLLSGIRCPALVVQGLADEYASTQHAYDLADTLPHAELWLVPEAGHMLIVEQADDFNQRLIEFLQKVREPNVQ